MPPSQHSVHITAQQSSTCTSAQTPSPCSHCSAWQQPCSLCTEFSRESIGVVLPSEDVASPQQDQETNQAMELLIGFLHTARSCVCLQPEVALPRIVTWLLADCITRESEVLRYSGPVNITVREETHDGSQEYEHKTELWFYSC